MKIGVVYGHVASNLGDLAINAGVSELLRQVAPGAEVTFVLLDANELYLDAGKASMDRAEGLRIVHLASHGDEPAGSERELRRIASAAAHALDPGAFLETAGLADCDAILYNSGEHLFALRNGENHEDLLWRLLPAVAAAQQGMRFVTLPSTLGPFEEPGLDGLFREFFTAGGPLAVREPRSAAEVEAFGARSPDVLLDPAFFLPTPVPAQTAAPPDSLGIVMRLEEFGLRVGKRRSAHVSAQLKQDQYRSSRAFQFSLALASEFLASQDGSVDLFVQTLADRELAGALAQVLQEQGHAERVRILQPASIPEYQAALSCTGLVVSSRFHACILAASLGRPVLGVHFDRHGHKLPGLFELMGIPGHCLPLSQQRPDDAARAAVARFRDREADFAHVPARLEALRGQTRQWLARALRARKPAKGGGRILLREFLTASEPLRRGRVDGLRLELQARQDKALRERDQSLEKLGQSLASMASAVSANETARDDVSARLETLQGALAAAERELALARAGQASLVAERDQQVLAIESLDQKLDRARAEILSLRQAHDEALSSARLAHAEQQEAARLAHAEQEEAAKKEYESRLAEMLAGQEASFAALLAGQNDRFEARAREQQATFEALLKDRDASYEGRLSEQAHAHEARLQALHADQEAERGQWQAERDTERAAAREHEQRAGRERALLQEALDRGTVELAQLRVRSRAQVDALATDLAALSRRAMDQQAQLVRLQAEHTASSADALRQRETLEQELELLTNSLSFRLGTALMSAGRGWRGAVALPRRLAGIVRAGFQRRSQARAGLALASTQSPDRDALEASVKEAFAAQGVAAAAELADADNLPAWMRAHLLSMLSQLVLAAQPGLARDLAERAHALEPLPFRAKWLALRRYDAGDISGSVELLDGAASLADYSATESERVLQIRGSLALMNALPVIPGKAAQAYAPEPGRVLYVAASTLPYVVSGYSIRTHALLRALANEGLPVECLMRPGFPEDRPDAVNRRGTSGEHDGVRYRHAGGPPRTGLTPQDWLQQASAVIAAVATDQRAALVHAASNHENALPALMAARGLGLPFVYEVRGFWELSAGSGDEAWSSSERCRLHTELERIVAVAADLVLAINGAVADRLAKLGVPREKIVIAPNAVDLQRFAPGEPAAGGLASVGLRDGVPTLAYIGSLVAYEGLDDLLVALSLPALAQRGVQLLVAGDGAERSRLGQQVDALGLGSRVAFAGRMPHAAVPGLLALADAVVLPRKPVEVCEVVPPIKPLEAMAMATPVLASDLPPLREMVRDGETGLLFRAGDPASLADAVCRLLADPATASAMGAHARAWVESERSWHHVGSIVRSAYGRVLESLPAGAAPAPVPALATGAPPSLPTLVAPGRNAFNTEQKARFQSLLESTYAEHGPDAAAAFARAQATGPRQRDLLSLCLARAATLCRRNGDLAQAHALALEAVEARESPASLRALARECLASNRFADAMAAIDRIEVLSGTLSEGELAIRTEASLLHGMLAEVARGADRGETSAQLVETIANKSVYVLHSSLPHLSGGYATRAHGLIGGIRQAGYDIRPYTRPGFPQDTRPELAAATVPAFDKVDDVSYWRLQGDAGRSDGETTYMAACVEAFEAMLRRERPAVVHGRSTYLIALPALIAARRLGIPFVYEVSGLWEVVHESRDSAASNKARTERMRLLEGVVARAADRVVTLTEAMREELIGRGVPATGITLVPNCVDPDRFLPLPRCQETAARLGIPDGVPVIGYVGSFMDYEGLDDLVHACELLAQQGRDFRLLLVGDGAAMPQVKQAVEASPVAGRILLTGRVGHDQVGPLYSLVDICPFPRKPWEVCEMVSPMKPFEPLAMGKAVVVSSVRALQDIIEDGVNGRVFAKGDVEDLARVLRELIDDRDQRLALGEYGKTWVAEHRSWRRAGELMVAEYRRAQAAVVA